MNDFTKDELEFILDGTRHWSNKNIPTPWVFEFKKKVESMIDNYCEHESNKIRYAVMKLRTTDDRDYEYKCSKCNKVLFQY